jgi:hypothetical protein
MKPALMVSLASLALLVVPSFVWFAGCSGGSGGADGGNDHALPDVYEEGPSSCPPSVKAGGPCEPIAPDKVFCAPTCDGGTGGCFCVEDPSTQKGVWKCETVDCGVKCAPDNDACTLEGSTFADSGPLPDTFVLPDTGAEAGEAGDGASDAKGEAATSDVRSGG